MPSKYYKNIGAEARRWFTELTDIQKGELGDQLVLGTFDWRDWFDTRPPKGFMAEVDRERLRWESER